MVRLFPAHSSNPEHKKLGLNKFSGQFYYFDPLTPTNTYVAQLNMNAQFVRGSLNDIGVAKKANTTRPCVGGGHQVTDMPEEYRLHMAILARTTPCVYPGAHTSRTPMQL